MKKYCVLLLTIFIFMISCNSGSNHINNTTCEETIEYVFPEADNEAGTLYFTCKNWDSDIYIYNSSTPYQEINILSLEPLDLRKIEISVPIEGEYAIEYVPDLSSEYLSLTDDMLNKDSELGTNVYNDFTFPYYLYQCYRGIDWKVMKQLYDEAVKASEQLAQWTESKDNLEYLNLEKIIKEYEDYRDLYWEDYEKLTSKDIPTFYTYTFRICFGVIPVSYDEYGFVDEYEHVNQITSESFQTIDIKIEDKNYTQNIGEVRIHGEELPLKMLNFTNTDYMEAVSITMGVSTDPWGDGKIYMGDIEFITKKDLTLKKMYLYESDINILGAHVTISDENEKNNLDFYWDVKSTLDVEAGKKVVINLIIQDPQAIQLEYAKRVYPVIEFDSDSKQYSYIQEHNLDRGASYRKGFWIRYASVFDGLSEQLKSYYDDYYRPIYETWREEWD